MTEQDVVELEELRRALRLIEFIRKDIEEINLTVAKGNLGILEVIITNLIEKKKNTREKQLLLW